MKNLDGKIVLVANKVNGLMNIDKNLKCGVERLNSKRCLAGIQMLALETLITISLLLFLGLVVFFPPVFLGYVSFDAS